MVNPYANTASVLTFDRPGQRRPGVRAGARLGRPPRGGARPRRRVRGHRRRPRSSADRRRGAAGAVDAGDRGPSRRARVALPVAASRAAEEICRRGGRRNRVDQAVGLPPDGGGPVRAGHLGRQPVRRVHLPPLPARLRRRGHPGQPVGPADGHRSRSCPSWWRRCPPSTSSTRRCTPRGTRRGWSCAPWSNGPRVATWSWWTGSRSSRTTDGPWSCPIPRSRSPTCGPRPPAMPPAEARAQEYAVRLEQLLR